MTRVHLYPSRPSLGMMGLVLGLAGLACDDTPNRGASDSGKAMKSDFNDPIRALPTQEGWHAHADNPVIKVGDLVDKGLWNDPSVLRIGSDYVMYMTSSLDRPFEAPIVPFRAVSKDGIHWNLEPPKPLLMPEDAPYVRIETPSVVRYRDKYHMYFSGIYEEGHIPQMEIGHATSADGIHWDKDPKYPVISSTGNIRDWNGFNVGEPGAVVYQDKIYLYFVATSARPSGMPPQLHVIAVATSPDGSVFSKPRIVLRQSDLYPARKSFAGYSTPMAVVHNGKVHLFHNVAYHNERAKGHYWQQVALHHAVSDDGIQFRQDEAAIWTRRDFDWTSGGIIGPSVLFEDDKLKMWFAGHMPSASFGALARRGWKGREFGIGYAWTDADRFGK